MDAIQGFFPERIWDNRLLILRIHGQNFMKRLLMSHEFLFCPRFDCYYSVSLIYQIFDCYHYIYVIDQIFYYSVYLIYQIFDCLCIIITFSTTRGLSVPRGVTKGILSCMQAQPKETVQTTNISLNVVGTTSHACWTRWSTADTGRPTASKVSYLDTVKVA